MWLGSSEITQVGRESGQRSDGNVRYMLCLRSLYLFIIFFMVFLLCFFCCFFFFFKFYFIFKLYNIVLVLPNIEMNPPRVYICSPS